MPTVSYFLGTNLGTVGMPKSIGKKHGRDLLTDLHVKAFKGPGRLNDGAGLSLSVTRMGFARWIYRYTYGGKPAELMLGSWPATSLKQARLRRNAARDLLQNGQDPRSALSAKARKRQQAVAAGVPTFGEYVETHLQHLQPTLKDKKARQPWELALRVYAKPLHDRRLNDITALDVASVLRPLWTTKKETARRLRWRLESVLAAAIVTGYREKDQQGNPITQRNPAAWADNLAELPGFKAKDRASKMAPKHHSAMPYGDVPAFIARLKSMENMSARALELAILTSARTSEVIGMRWDEIDQQAALWTLPASRMKAGREHVVPLTAEALAAIAAIPKMNASPFVFSGVDAGTHMSNMALLMLLRRMEVPFTAHGFRSSFRTWAAECTQFPREIAELALAHTVGSEVERAYSRSTLLEKRRALAMEWARYLYAASKQRV